MNLILTFIVGIIANLGLLYLAVKWDITILIILFTLFVLVQTISYTYIFISKLKPFISNLIVLIKNLIQ